MYDDDDIDDILSILYIRIAKSSVCPTGRGKLNDISSIGNNTMHDDNTTLIPFSAISSTSKSNDYWQHSYISCKKEPVWILSVF